nr:hypothetical protein [Tanacetum cinerariifolium]GFD41542.1 hypothetical protein [Tanacetum cinerariifolium]
GSGIGRIGGDAGSRGDGICAGSSSSSSSKSSSKSDSRMYLGDSAMGEAAAGSGCSSAEKT